MRLPALMPVLTVPALPGMVFGNILVTLQKTAVPQLFVALTSSICRQMVPLGKQCLRGVTWPICFDLIAIHEARPDFKSFCVWMLCVIWDRKGCYRLPKTVKCLNSCVCCNMCEVLMIA